VIITKIDKADKSKFRIYIDEEFAFLLYEKDLDQYNLEEGQTLLPELYERLIEKLIYPRAIEKALSILKYMDRCEHELRHKLSQAQYSTDIIDRVLQYVMNYGYLDDERYAKAYVKSRMNRKSKMIILGELYQKGVSKIIIDQVMDTEYESDDQEDAELLALQKAIAKKTKDPKSLSPQDKQKLMASLYRKGFDISKIKQFL
jgi:regulatory protein